MWAATVSREEFLGIIQGELVRTKGAREIESLEHWHDTSGIVLLWADDPSLYTFPSVVLVSDDKQNDFLAWVAGFLSGIRPFTAFCRVTDLPTAKSLMKARPQKPPQRTLAALVGAVVGEATSYTRGSRLERPAAFRACASTLSFAVLKALCVGLNVEVDFIGRLWLIARRLTNQQALPVDLDDVRQPLGALLAVLEGGTLSYGHEIEGLPRGLSELFFEYAQTGRMRENSFADLGRSFDGLQDASVHMQDTREHRIQYLDHALRQVALSRDKQAAAFLAGLLTSQVAPGSFDHLKLLQQYSPALPLAFMWYGVFAGLHEKTTMLNFADGIGRRLVREIIRPENLLDSPHCDVSVAELQVLSRDVAEVDLRTTSSAHLEIELLPCVVSSMRATSRHPDFTQPPLLQTFAAEDDIADWLGDMDSAIDRITKAQQRLHRILGLQNKKPKRKP
jgi:hypothetical protein